MMNKISPKILADIRAPTMFHKSNKILGNKILTKILADIRAPYGLHAYPPHIISDCTIWVHPNVKVWYDSD